MIKQIIEKVSLSPKIFIFLRRVLENNFKGEIKTIKEELSLTEDDQVLDLGCGTGEFSIFIPPGQYTGVDIEPAYIKYAQKNYSGKFLLADAKRLPFRDKSFSKIIVIGVFHHLNDSDSRAVLKEAKRVLKDDGILLFMEDVKSSENGFLTKIIHKLDKGDYIRSSVGYEKLVSPLFSIKKSYTMKSGLNPYQVFVLRKQ